MPAPRSTSSESHFETVRKVRRYEQVADQIRRTLRTVSRWLSLDRKSTRLNSSHVRISYAVFCLKKKKSRAMVTAPLTVPHSGQRERRLYRRHADELPVHAQYIGGSMIRMRLLQRQSCGR